MPLSKGEAPTTTIYVYLPDEAVEVWRPIQARHLGADRYQIVSVNNASAIERLEFNSGDTVRCELRLLSGGEALVAYERIQQSALQPRQRDGPAGHVACCRKRRARPPRALRSALGRIQGYSRHWRPHHARRTSPAEY